MELEELSLQLHAVIRVGELETTTTLLRHKIKLLSTELDAARQRIVDYMNIQRNVGDTNADIDNILSVQAERVDGNKNVELGAALRGKALVDTELAICRARMFDAQQLAEARAIELANLRVQIKEAKANARAAAAEYSASIAALMRDRQAVSLELSTSQERTRAALAFKTRNIQELTEALQASRHMANPQDVDTVSRPSSNSKGLPKNDSGNTNASFLHAALEIALSETHDAVQEIARLSEDLENCRAQLREKENEVLFLNEQLLEAQSANTAAANPDSSAYLISYAVSTPGNSSISQIVSANQSIMAAPLSKFDLLALLKDHVEGVLAAGISREATNPTSFGWIDRARRKREMQRTVSEHLGDTEVDQIPLQDISHDFLDSDDDLALPSLENVQSLQSSSDQTILPVNSIPSPTVVVNLEIIEEILSERVLQAQNMHRKSELRLTTERDNVAFERDSYRQEIMRFLEIDAAGASTITAQPASSPSKTSAIAAKTESLVASSVAAAVQAAKEVHLGNATSTPLKTMAIIRGFAESNGRLQAQNLALVQQLEDCRAILQKTKLSESYAMKDLLRAEEHNTQLQKALNLATASASR